MKDIRIEALQELGSVWMKSAKARVQSMKAEGSLFKSMLGFAQNMNIDSDTFKANMKTLQDKLIRRASSEAEKKAIRSTASSNISVIANTLAEGRSLTLDGKPKGKTRLEKEHKAVEAGMPANEASEADTKALESAIKSPTDDAQIAKAMSLADALKSLLEGASDSVVSDVAYEILSVDKRLTDALLAGMGIKKAA